MSWPWDTVSDGDLIMKELTEAMLGVWDYIKNSDATSERAKTWALDWLGEY